MQVFPWGEGAESAGPLPGQSLRAAPSTRGLGLGGGSLVAPAARGLGEGLAARDCPELGPAAGVRGPGGSQHPPCRSKLGIFSQDKLSLDKDFLRKFSVDYPIPAFPIEDVCSKK